MTSEVNLVEIKESFCPIDNYIYFVLCEFHAVFGRWQLTEIYNSEGVGQ